MSEFPIPRPFPLETIRTERLVLRPLTIADAPELSRAVNHKDISENTRIVHPYTLEDAYEFVYRIERSYGTGDEIVWPIRTTDAGPLLGTVGLHLQRADRLAELGYWLHRDHRGKGYASEAATAALAFGFNTLHLDRIYASWYHDNPASGRILDKIGMKHEGVLRAHSLRGGRSRDIVHVGLLRHEFLEMEKNR